VTTLTVICPVYNEAEVIGEFHRELARVLDGLVRSGQPRARQIGSVVRGDRGVRYL